MKTYKILPCCSSTTSEGLRNSWAIRDSGTDWMMLLRSLDFQEEGSRIFRRMWAPSTRLILRFGTSVLEEGVTRGSCEFCHPDEVLALVPRLSEGQRHIFAPLGLSGHPGGCPSCPLVGDVAGHLGIGDLLRVQSFRGLRKEGRMWDGGVTRGSKGRSRGGSPYLSIHLASCLWVSLSPRSV